MWSGRIRPCIAQGPEAHAAFGQRAQDVEQIARRPSQTVQTSYNHEVAPLNNLEQSFELIPIRPENVVALGGFQVMGPIRFQNFCYRGSDGTKTTARLNFKGPEHFKAVHHFRVEVPR